MRGRAENLLGALATSLSDEIDRVTTDAAGHGASGPAALSLLMRRPGCTIEVLRSHIGLSHSATVRLVDRLVDDGLVVRRPGGDDREVAVHLTARGRRRALRVHEQRRAVLGRALAGLSVSDRRHLELLLDRVLRTEAVVHEDPQTICRLCEVPVCPLRRCPVPAAR
ncbi:MarR family winged helix-turn-helix transcriptional regulator [Actinomarinicola tropica]|nr:MarR family transcriptional regulator [Actinomarinicola tropica]